MATLCRKYNEKNSIRIFSIICGNYILQFCCLVIFFATIKNDQRYTARRSFRLASIAFGAGAGFGMGSFFIFFVNWNKIPILFRTIGYTECRLSFEKNIHFQRKVIAELETPVTQIPVETTSTTTTTESNKSE